MLTPPPFFLRETIGAVCTNIVLMDVPGIPTALELVCVCVCVCVCTCTTCACSIYMHTKLYRKENLLIHPTLLIQLFYTCTPHYQGMYNSI